MIHQYMQNNGYGHTIQVNPMVKYVFLCLALDSMIVFMTSASCLNGGHSYDFADI
jgi:hypothetical protein